MCIKNFEKKYREFAIQVGIDILDCIVFQFNNQADLACNGLLDNLSVFTQRIFSSISLVCVLFYNSWQLSIVAIIILFVAVAPLTRVKHLIKSLVTKNAVSITALNTTYNETFAGNKTICSYNLEEYQKRPIGTGPFMLEEGGVPGEKYCTVKFDDYWGQKAKLDRVEYYVIPDDVTLANAMEAGEIDTYDVNNLEKVEEYMADPDTYVLLNARDSAQSYIGINANFEPLNDPKVREAIALSIDRDMVCDEYFKGTEEKSKGFLPTFCRYALEDYWNPEYNPEKAKQLLAEAGYPDGFAIDMYAPNDTLSAGPATLVQQFLTQIGLKVDLQTVDFGVWLDKAKAGEIPIYLFWDSCPVIPDNVLKQFTSESTINYIAYNDPEYDRIVAAAVEENDLAKKAELYNEAQKNIMDSGCLYTMTTYSIHQVVNPRVKDLKITTGLMLTCREAYIEE